MTPALCPPVASAVLAVGLWLPACADLDDALESLGVLADLPHPGPHPPPFRRSPSEPRLAALSDRAFATHPFTVPWVRPRR